jgi:asparagine synthase (glutamine-hydrolysing)
MCGVAGLVSGNSLDVGYQELVMKKLSHRGPDSRGYWKSENCILYHARLSILDLSEVANQPFSDESGRYKLVFNGEIYNYLKLRKEIDYNWRTTSDTEFLMAWLIKYQHRRLN